MSELILSYLYLSKGVESVFYRKICIEFHVSFSLFYWYQSTHSFTQVRVILSMWVMLTALGFIARCHLVIEL